MRIGACLIASVAAVALFGSGRGVAEERRDAQAEAALKAEAATALTFAPLTRALTSRPDELRKQPANTAAQYALAIVLEHGLRGEKPDKAEAARLKATATAARPTMTPIYSPPVTPGGAGRMIFINNGATWVRPEEATQIEACIAAIQRPPAEESLASAAPPYMAENSGAVRPGRDSAAAACGSHASPVFGCWHGRAVRRPSPPARPMTACVSCLLAASPT